MTKENFKAVCEYAVDIIKFFAPEDTGNLKNNAVKFEWKDDHTFSVYVDPSIAPYMVYTEEEWIRRPPPNPNEKWFASSVQFIVDYLAAIFGGTVDLHYVE